MGYGLPAAVAAKLVHPERIVVCFTGDGDFVMSSSELATAVQYELPVVVLLVNNGMYATIRMHQERLFPGRVVGTDLANPDFAALAQAYGASASGRARPRTSRRRSSARSRRGSRRCSSSASIPSGSARASSSASCGGRRVRREEIRVEGLAEPISHFTDAVRAGGFLFVSGIVAGGRRGRLVGGDDVVAQTRQVFENMRAVLAAGGCGFEDVVKVTVFLTDVDDRPLDQPGAAGVLRRHATGVDTRRGAAPGGPGREGRDRGVALVP